MRTEEGRLLPRASLVAGALLVALTAITYGSGTSQQSLESVMEPAAYARALLAGGDTLRAIVAIDDAFIAAYVLAGLLLARRLENPSTALLVRIMGGSSLVAGLLDLEENHHLLAMLELASRDVAIPLGEILGRSDRSQLKWMIGHVGFVFAGLAIAATSPLTKVLRASLVFVQLPIGALTWAVTAAPYHDALVLVRYLSVIAGFVVIGALARSPDGLVAIGSDAPA